MPAQHGGDKVAVGIVADDDVGPSAQFAHGLMFDIMREAIQVGPDGEAGNPLWHDLAIGFSERDAEYPRIVATADFFQALIAGGSWGLGNQAGRNEDFRLHIDALHGQTVAHFGFEGANLVEDVNDLPSGVRASQDIGLAKKTVGGQNQ